MFKGFVQVLLLLVLVSLSPVQATPEFLSGMAAVRQAELPLEAQDTFHLIKQNGPFPFPRDGVVFGNRERQLPAHPRGYYHEYTVKTPGARNRGARRIVCGVVPECYYSDDHYQSFRQIKN
jgi:ribonuclease T1